MMPAGVDLVVVALGGFCGGSVEPISAAQIPTGTTDFPESCAATARKELTWSKMDAPTRVLPGVGGKHRAVLCGNSAVEVLVVGATLALVELVAKNKMLGSILEPL